MPKRVAVLLAATVAALLTGNGVAVAAPTAPASSTPVQGGALAASGGGGAGLAGAEPNDHGPYVLLNMVTYFCADIPGYGPGYVNAPVTQYDCNMHQAEDNQFFWF